MGEVGGKIAASPLSLLDVFDGACPEYMAMGMSYEQFWDGDTSAHKMYRIAKKKRLSEQNQIAWLQGMYFYVALVSVAPYVKAFSKAKPRPYMEEPIDLWEEERKRREENEAKARFERMRAKMEAFAKTHNERQQKLEMQSEVDSNA